MADPTKYEYKCYYRYKPDSEISEMWDWLASVKCYYGGVEPDYSAPINRSSFVTIFLFAYIEDAVEFKLRFG